jgi:hypothetical protein
MNTKFSESFGDLADSEVLARIHDAVLEEHVATARVIGLLVEIDVRRLYLAEGCSSLFTYCTQVLHFSEHAAYNRIETARAARRFPVIRHLIEVGAITLTTARLLAPHLTDANHRDVLERARHKSKREIELLIATLKPQPDMPSTIRKLPTRVVTLTLPASSPQPELSATVAAPAAERTVPPLLRPSEITPLAPERYKIQFTVSRETHDQLRRAQDLLRHTVPNGDPALIFERALRLLIADLERARAGKTGHPRAAGGAREHSRHIPAAVKRTVWRRDEGRCAFAGTRGRCTETGFLEYHHVVPFADGGPTTSDNLELRCRAHNRYEADRWFGAGEPPIAREARAAFSA